MVLVAVAIVLGGCAGPGPEPAPGAMPAASRDPGRPLPSPLPEIAARVNGEAVPLHRIIPLARVELLAMPEGEREARQPEAMRRALERYIDRELLFQEAVSRGLTADRRAIDWAYDQARGDVKDEQEWARSLAEMGFDEKAFRTELRVRQTVAALLETEEAEPLLERLRSTARIETFL